MEDILLVYKDGLTNIHEILKLFNNISPTLTFTMEKEINNRINFLDITIYKTDHNIYIKPTATYTIISNNSCHPPEHKMAANKKKEYHTVKQILLNNKYDAKILDKVISTKKYRNTRKKETVKTTTHIKLTTKMAQVHIHRMTNEIYHQIVQKHHS